MPAAAHQRNPSSAGSSAPPVPISITICGDGGCGKSSITLRLVRSQWVSEYDPTIEDSYSLTRRIDGVTYHLSLTDTAGQEEYRGMWASSNLGADAFLLVYDITSPDSLHALQYFTDLIDMEAEIRLDNAERARRAGLPLGGAHGLGGASAKVVPPIKMVAGNKCDLAEGREVSAAQGLEWARRHGCAFMETSARLEVNIEETFRIIVRRVVEARRQAEMTGGGGGSSGGLDGAEEEGGAEPWDGNGNGNGIRAGEKRKRRGPAKPLTPLPIDDEDELGEGGRGGGGGGGRRRGGLRLRGRKLPQTSRTGDEGGEGFWRQMRCW